MIYYILNGIEVSFFILPVYINDEFLRLCYMGVLYSFLTSEYTFYYTEIKNNLLYKLRK